MSMAAPLSVELIPSTTIRDLSFRDRGAPGRMFHYLPTFTLPFSALATGHLENVKTTFCVARSVTYLKIDNL
jgi:hypothetical protein